MEIYLFWDISYYILKMEKYLIPKIMIWLGISVFFTTYNYEENNI